MVQRANSDYTCPPPPRVHRTILSLKIRSKQECSLDTPFGAHDSIVKRWQHIPRQKLPNPFKAQCDGGLQLALFSRSPRFMRKS